MRLKSDVNYTGIGWIRRNNFAFVCFGVIFAIIKSWWIGLLFVLGGLLGFVFSERIAWLARRRMVRRGGSVSA
jgi:hypothetical protein